MKMVFDNFVFVFIHQSRPARNWPELFLGVSCANLPPVKYNVVKFCTTYHASNCTNGESVADKNPTLYHAHSRPAPFPAPIDKVAWLQSHIESFALLVKRKLVKFCRVHQLLQQMEHKDEYALIVKPCPQTPRPNPNPVEPSLKIQGTGADTKILWTTHHSTPNF